MKTPTKIALINVRDCPRSEFKAYWQITIIEPPDGETDWSWRAKLMSYEPVGYRWQGKDYSLEQAAKKWPEGPPTPSYPSDARLARQAAFDKMSPADQALERVKQEAHRAACIAAWEAVPQPQHLIEETVDTAKDKDAADTAAQEWVRAKIKAHRKPKGATVHGYAIPLPLDPLGDLVRDVYDRVRYLWRKYGAPMLAVAYNTTVRNNRLTQVLNAIDGGAGAGLLRIYDGSRPATCGTATTLGAELTYSDPSGSVASQVLTFSAITADPSANASITASWYRSVDSTGTCVEDGNVGTSGSDLNLNTVTITVGVQVAVSSKTITAGNP